MGSRYPASGARSCRHDWTLGWAGSSTSWRAPAKGTFFPPRSHAGEPRAPCAADRRCGHEIGCPGLVEDLSRQAPERFRDETTRHSRRSTAKASTCDPSAPRLTRSTSRLLGHGHPAELGPRLDRFPFATGATEPFSPRTTLSLRQRPARIYVSRLRASLCSARRFRSAVAPTFAFTHTRSRSLTFDGQSGNAFQLSSISTRGSSTLTIHGYPLTGVRG